MVTTATMADGNSTPRVFPVAEWAPTQEALFAEPAQMEWTGPNANPGPSSSDMAGSAGNNYMTNNDADSAAGSTEPKSRRPSLSLPWRHRPQSFLFASGEEDHLSQRLSGVFLTSPSAQQHQQHSYSYSHNGGHGTKHNASPPRPDSTFRGLFKRASTSLRGMVRGERERGEMGSGSGTLGVFGGLSSRRNSQSQSRRASTLIPAASDVHLDHHARPGTAHSTWHRLRQATSFRHSRLPYQSSGGLLPTMSQQYDAGAGGGGGGGRGDGMTDHATQTTMATNMPMPGVGNEPPIIPRNTGAAAKAAVALQNEYLALAATTAAAGGIAASTASATTGGGRSQQKRAVAAAGLGSGSGSVQGSGTWLSTAADDLASNNDRESGIGIAVTTTGLGAGSVSGSFLNLDSGSPTESSASGRHRDPAISRIDFVARLPPELGIQILSHLDKQGLAVACRVSRHWRDVANNQHIWRESFLREKTATFAMGGPVKPGTGLGVPRVMPGMDWKEVYRVKEELDKRWKEGQARPVYLMGHADSVYCLQFDE